MVAAAPQTEARGKSSRSAQSKDASFGQRIRPTEQLSRSDLKTSKRDNAHDASGEHEMTWVPSAGNGGIDPEDMLVPGGRGKSKKAKEGKRRGVETFGAGLERGAVGVGDEGRRELSENERHGRSRRRSGVRSGSKNAFRGL